MKFPVYVNLVVVGIESYKPEGSQLGVIKTSKGLSLAEVGLERGKKSSETAMELVRKYIDVESFDPNLFLFSPAAFIDAPDRYKKTKEEGIFHQDIILVYKIIVPLNAFLQNGMQWIDFEKGYEDPVPFCKDHLDIIKTVLQNG